MSHLGAAPELLGQEDAATLLPRPLRAKIAGKRGIFDYTKRLAGYGRAADQQISEEARRPARSSAAEEFTQ